MFFLFALIAAALACGGARTVRANRTPYARRCLYGVVGSTFPQPAPLISKRYRLQRKAGWAGWVPRRRVAPVELKSSPVSLRPAAPMTVTSSNWRPTVYWSKTFVVSRFLTDWSNTRWQVTVEYTPSLRASLITLLDEIRTAKVKGECHINHNEPAIWPVLRFQFCLRRGSDLSALLAAATAL